MYDLIIYVCGHGLTQDETCKCLVDIFKTKMNVDIRWVSRDALIGRSRSRACTQFLWCEDSPYMLFIDSDITFTAKDVEDIYRGMLAGYEVLAGIYSVADGTFVPAQSQGQISWDGKIYEMKYVSTGFLGISRNVLKGVRSKLNLPLLHKGEWCECWPFFESGGLPQEKIYISEDWDFSLKARKAGFKVYLHTGVRCGHLKTRQVTAEEAMNNMAKPQAGAAIQTECLPQSTLLSDIALYLGITQPALVEMVKTTNPAEVVAKEWKEKTCSDREFYKTNKSQLLDLMLFNMQHGYWQDRVWPLNTIRDKKILDVGCGIGTTSLFLAQNRNKVIGWDINEEAIKFANHRLSKFGFSNVRFVTELPTDIDYDVVVAIDTLEHIENLKDFLVNLNGLMRLEGRLYHADVFENHPDHHPMHIDHSAKIDEWLREAGFMPIDGRWAAKVKDLPVIKLADLVVAHA